MSGCVSWIDCDRQCVGCPFDESGLVFSEQPLITARVKRLKIHNTIYLITFGVLWCYWLGLNSQSPGLYCTWSKERAPKLIKIVSKLLSIYVIITKQSFSLQQHNTAHINFLKWSSLTVDNVINLISYTCAFASLSRQKCSTGERNIVWLVWHILQ